MKKIIAILSLCCLVTMSAHASTKEEKAAELLKMMNTQAIFGAAYEQVSIPLTCELVMPTTAETKLKEDFMRIADVDSLLWTLSQFWVKNYTEKELDTLIAYYKTDLGKKTIRMMPQYTQYSMAVMEKWSKEKKDDFINLGKELARKYPKRSGADAEACVKSKMGM